MAPAPSAEEASAWLGRPVAFVGEGAWSRCFGDDEVVVRFGAHRSDFEKDRTAAALPGLPVPAVHRIEPAFGGWACVSDRVHGVPIEALDEDGWRAVLPDVERLLGDLAAAPPPGEGFGLWERPMPSWRAFLLSVADDGPHHRTPGWRAAVARSPAAERAFDAGYRRLAELADDVPEERHVVHADLLNKNVLVAGGRIAGVFDWGCALTGDARYERAGIDFFRTWDAAADPVLPPVELDGPMRACLLHVGLDHLAYAALVGHDALGWIAERTLSFVD